jgi:hypothetical protein
LLAPVYGLPFSATPSGVTRLGATNSTIRM